MQHDRPAIVDARAHERLSLRKEQAIQAYTSAMMVHYLKLAKDLSEAGHTQAQILEAVESLRPQFDAGAAQVLRTVTIGSMHLETHHG